MQNIIPYQNYMNKVNFKDKLSPLAKMRSDKIIDSIINAYNLI